MLVFPGVGHGYIFNIGTRYFLVFIECSFGGWFGKVCRMFYSCTCYCTSGRFVRAEWPDLITLHHLFYQISKNGRGGGG